MLNLIEKIVTKILNDSDYLAGCMIAFCTMLFMIILFGGICYEDYLKSKVMLAKINAGQIVESSNGNCKCK